MSHLKILAFDTSTETMSIALTDGCQIWQHSGAGGAKASAALIPAAMALLTGAGLRLADLDAIAFGAGPGSFTGLRTACAVAQGLGFGAAVPVLPVDTLMAVAEEARDAEGATRVVAALDARMDEMYVGRYLWADGAWQAEGDFRLVRPEALEVPATYRLAGNAVPVYGPRLAPRPGNADDVAALPGAAAMLRLAPALLAAGAGVPASEALPRYIRDKVAQTTAERLAAKQLLADRSAVASPRGTDKVAE